MGNWRNVSCKTNSYKHSSFEGHYNREARKRASIASNGGKDAILRVRELEKDLLILKEEFRIASEQGKEPTLEVIRVISREGCNCLGIVVGVALLINYVELTTKKQELI